ncbi:16S rRNA (cytidine(1402)-2'-O)-methyltransferase [Candidatus Campbellbacteria bacterium]|nr:16S rRNA (cytidine(1402)-2'-O)-methyltransferase [Candidatus Campbellbacteria bacterium]|tara:strand:+ start:431 stop:1117 length:687 start_codon:yes stop_codon:yes gene_type:complete
MKNSEFYVVATPIGNLGDITYRAVEILKEVDIILSEDTRVTKHLLNTYGIITQLKSYHANSSEHKENEIINLLNEGKKIALVSDAGTPTISDPGVKLISRIRSESPETLIRSLPGPAALIAGLSITGFTGNQFTFYGFLPHKKGRNSLFQEMKDSSRISVFYESPHRLVKTLQALNQVMGSSRKMCVARELTKIYEEHPVMTVEEMVSYYEMHPQKVKGECVIIIDSL